MTSPNPPHHAAGVRLQAWVDQQPWSEGVSVGVGIDPANGTPCLHLYVQKRAHRLALRPQPGALPEVWEDVPVLIHQVGPFVAQTA